MSIICVIEDVDVSGERSYCHTKVIYKQK